MGPFTFDPATSTRPAVVLVLNPEDPFQRAMWSGWSLQMFLREAPLYAVDYLFVPYTYDVDAAVDLSYYMYRQMLVAARAEYGNNETTDDELRRRVFAHVHFVTSPGRRISAQITRLLRQWRQDMRVLHAYAAASPNVSTVATPAAASAAASAVVAASSRLRQRRSSDLGTSNDNGGGSVGGAGSGGGGDDSSSDRVWAPGPRWRLLEQQDARAPVDKSPLQLARGKQQLLHPLHSVPHAEQRRLSQPEDQGKQRAEEQGQGIQQEQRQDQEEGQVQGPRPGSRERLSSSAGAGAGALELTVGRLDAWYGWLPSPPSAAAAGAAPLVSWESIAGAAGAGRSPCDPLPATPADGEGGDAGSVAVSGSGGNAAAAASGGSCGGGGDGRSSGSGSTGGGGVSGAWVLVFNASREGHPECTYGRAVLALQRAGALGVIFASSPGRDVELMAPDADGGEDGRGEDGGEGGGEADEQEQPSIPATMVAYTDGLDLLTLMAAAEAGEQGGGGGVSVEFGVQQIPAAWFVADPWVGLSEAGWAQLPALMHAGWAAWWHFYLRGLRERLHPPGKARREHVVQIFDGQAFPGPHGITAAATLPRAPSRRFRRLQLDFALGCEGPFDAACPAWDHMVQLFACCDGGDGGEDGDGGDGGADGADVEAAADPWVDRCAPCPTTLWAPPGGDGKKLYGNGGGAATGGGGGEQRQGGEDPPQRCGLELGRWATPFRRRVGRWLTDATSLLAVLGDGGRCSFTVQTAPWADGNWTATLALRFSSKPPAAAATADSVWDGEGGEGASAEGGLLHAADTAASATEGGGVESGVESGSSDLASDSEANKALRPIQLIPLFGSAVFDSSYNKARAPVSFPTPPNARAATIVSLITGHGSDAHGCGEFCPTSHHLYVNGIEVAVRNLSDAGTAWGCADAVLYGAVPNQHGTWFYGRGGWCDGSAVDPWVVEVELGSELRPPGSGSNNSVWYKGLYGGRDPEDPPEGFGAGYIMMQSVLVFYG